MSANNSSSKRIEFAENIKILPTLSEKIIADGRRYSEKLPLILYYQASYVNKSSGEKIDTGDGFLLQFVERSNLIEDISGETLYVKILINEDMDCFLRIPLKLSNKIFHLDLINGVINSIIP